MGELDDELEVGIYEQPVTHSVSDALRRLDAKRVAIRSMTPEETPDRVALHLQREIERALFSIPESKRVELSIALIDSVVASLVEITGQELFYKHLLNSPASVLLSVMDLDPNGSPRQIRSPGIPLIDTALLTNAKRDRNIGWHLENEIESASSIDILIAFVRRSGIESILPALRRHCDRGGKVRLITTTYTGSTQKQALETLVEIGVDVKVSYDVSASRLHAKAWMFNRNTGYSTAYIGSSNLTAQALNSGLEWNLRISEARNSQVIEKVKTVFESYWQNPEFRTFDSDEFSQFQKEQKIHSDAPFVSPFEISPIPFQNRLLELVELERAKGRHRNLIVAATGTGKTVMSAFDYKKIRSDLKRSRLLFIAHRKEILEQSLSVFRHVLQDFTFGEMWVDEESPLHFEHVFASVQTLSKIDLTNFDPNYFDVVIVDEFHHAAAPTYQKILDYLEPVELLGLTATPERADGISILHWFDDRIAAELRLWDAIEQGYLSPFAYFGIHDGTDLTGLTWHKGRGYDADELTNLLTANDVWANRVIHEFINRIDNPSSVTALGFCVSIAHAEFMANKFSSAGIPSVVVSGRTKSADRKKALSELRDGKLRVIFSVDVFNEGVDVPNVDAILMLRPTESATVFMQQLGRGLRKSPGKEICTVLDFVGLHRKEFRFDLKYRALLGGTREELKRQIEDDFPYLPGGSSFKLDMKSSEIVLNSLKSAIPSSWSQRVAELKAIQSTAGKISMATYLSETGLELEDLYSNNRSWSDLCEAAGLKVLESGPDERSLRRSIGRLLHVNDRVRLSKWIEFLINPAIDVSNLSQLDERLLRMFLAQLFISTELDEIDSISKAFEVLKKHPQIQSELLELFEILDTKIDHVQFELPDNIDVPLLVHARYTRVEILAGFGDGEKLQIPTWREGVKWLPKANADVFAITFDKSDGDFSPSTSYKDYAISADLIHWESQNTTSETSPTGMRYQQHVSRGSDVYLFSRLRQSERSFWFCGPATYVSHEGDRPMAITWKLDFPLPGDLYSDFAAAIA